MWPLAQYVGDISFFYFHNTLEEFEDASTTSHFGFVLNENSGREIACPQDFCDVVAFLKT